MTELIALCVPICVECPFPGRTPILKKLSTVFGRFPGCLPLVFHGLTNGRFRGCYYGLQ